MRNSTTSGTHGNACVATNATETRASQCRFRRTRHLTTSATVGGATGATGARTRAVRRWPYPRMPRSTTPRHGWECKRGYRRQSDGCTAVAPPAHAVLDYWGHGWECRRGYRRSDEGCDLIAVPSHATLDGRGRDWICTTGYVRRDSACVSLAAATTAEIRQVIIDESVASYPGRCPCPYFVDGAGRSCGARSAYSRAGGYGPLCYPQDVSDAQVRAYQRRFHARG